MNKKNTINYPKSAAMGFFSKGLKNEFETAVVNEPSVFEPLKFYCRSYMMDHIFGIPLDEKSLSYSRISLLIKMFGFILKSGNSVL